MLAFITGAKAQVTTNINFPHDDKIVQGCITIPAGQGPFPAIVIAPGSGAMDRDGTISMGSNVQCLHPGLVGQTLRPYKDLGDALAAAGYVVLRYNKLEYTYSQNLGAISFNKLWLPFESAIEYVRKRPEVDSASIILIGHSEGSTLIPLVAKSRSDIRALISIGGARTPFDSVLCRQLTEFTAKCGGNMQQAKNDSSYIQAYFNNVRAGNFSASTPALFGVSAAVWSDYVAATDPVVQHYNDCFLPTLFVGLANDINVPPSELLRFQNEITVPADFWSVPGTNHYMTYSATPTIAKAVPDTIIYWLSKLNLVTGTARQKSDQGMGVYPNPVQNRVEVAVPGPGWIRISDVTGREIEKHRCNSKKNTIDLGGLAPGVYLLRYDGSRSSAISRLVKS